MNLHHYSVIQYLTHISGSQPKMPEGATWRKGQLCNTRKQQRHKQNCNDKEVFRMYQTYIYQEIANFVKTE